jgi:hypothetical protein
MAQGQAQARASEVVSATNQLKLKAPDGKQRLTDVLETQRAIQLKIDLR